MEDSFSVLFKYNRSLLYTVKFLEKKTPISNSTPCNYKRFLGVAAHIILKNFNNYLRQGSANCGLQAALKFLFQLVKYFNILKKKEKLVSSLKNNLSPNFFSQKYLFLDMFLFKPHKNVFYDLPTP